MKFGKTLETHLTPEWREQYIKYAALKAMITRGIENAPSTQDNNYYITFEREFFEFCKEELTRVNNFFDQKLAEARRKYGALKISLLSSMRQPEYHLSNISLQSSGPDRQYYRPMKASHLRFAFAEFYLSLNLIKNFQELNLTGFRKICKKYDKNFQSTAGVVWYKQYVVNATFTEDHDLARMIDDIEDLYTEYLANGDRSKAMTRLRVPPLGTPTSACLLFRSGFALGIFIIGVVLTIISYFRWDIPEDERYMFVRLYRGPVIYSLFCIFVTINVTVWQHFGVNHTLIFGIDPRYNLQPAVFLEITSIVGYICTSTMLLYLNHTYLDIRKPFMFPLIFILFAVILLINPLPIMNLPARVWLIKVISRMLLAPLFYVQFADFWLGDQLNSLVLCSIDFYYMSKFYYLYFFDKEDAFLFEPDYMVIFLRCFPAWIRFAQCLRRFYDSKYRKKAYILNAIKYASTFVVVFFSTMQMNTAADYPDLLWNPYTWCYLFSALLNNVYCIMWDILKDFYLFQIRKGKNCLLRESLVYNKIFYYFVIVEDIVLRMTWVLEFVLVYKNVMSPFNCKSMISLCEITRRFIWNFVRLENEHLNNVGHFRATRDIYINTLNERQEKLLERMMSEEQRETGSVKSKKNKFS